MGKLLKEMLDRLLGKLLDRLLDWLRAACIQIVEGYLHYDTLKYVEIHCESQSLIHLGGKAVSAWCGLEGVRTSRLLALWLEIYRVDIIDGYVSARSYRRG